MFAAAADENAARTWLMRLVGFLMMAIGLALILQPMAVVLDVIPFLGNLAGMAFAVAALLAAVVLTSITIAIAWIFVRPMIAGGLLLLATGIIMLVSLSTTAQQ